ncbi:unnamed protein product [Calicophoron daubneyi]|uniref:Chloride intracellular channel n=1 Tax=Calicophoron daubneyi TaxID=300641 RepID=A0AAV2T0A5_CALDB
MGPNPDNENLPVVELFVRAAASDKSQKGSSLKGQTWHMILYRLSEMGLIKLQLTPIAPGYIPEEYDRLNAALHLPVAWIKSGEINNKDVAGLSILSDAQLVELLGQLNHRYLVKELQPLESQRVELVYNDLYANFMGYLHNDKEKPLRASLTRVDEYLAKKNTKYLVCNELTTHDCQLMPRLQQIRVLGRHYKNYDIPTQFAAIWKYISLMYGTDTFNVSCPADIDIILSFEDKYPDMNAINKKPREVTCLKEVPSTPKPK